MNKNGPGSAPWGSAAALLAACVATTAGLLRGNGPEVILWRAGVAAALVGALVAVAVGVWHWAHARPAKR